jgi:hypothetical protein
MRVSELVQTRILVLTSRDRPVYDRRIVVRESGATVGTLALESSLRERILCRRVPPDRFLIVERQPRPGSIRVSQGKRSRMLDLSEDIEVLAASRFIGYVLLEPEGSPYASSNIQPRDHPIKQSTDALNVDAAMSVREMRRLCLTRPQRSQQS